MTAEACKIADQSAGGRIALFLEGGYNLGAVETSLAACARVLIGRGHGADALSAGGGGAELTPSPLYEAEIERVRRELAPYWAVCR